MPGNQFTTSASGALLFFALAQPGILGAVSETPAPQFLGVTSCSSSGCHGGASEVGRQVAVWSQYDFHHQRPGATLTTARSERLASVLKLGAAAESPRCTVCHAPLKTVPAALRAPVVEVNDGVSCENCHGPAANWLLSHTRKDYTRADRVRAGMRDLRDSYVRANTCVACHQNVDRDILRAGHPELIFELDGQVVTEPRHWRKERDQPGAQLWVVGQLVALREMSWQLEQDGAPDENQLERWSGLLWVLQNATAAVSELRAPATALGPVAAGAQSAGEVRQRSDQLAKQAAGMQWGDEATLAMLQSLAQKHSDFGLPPKGLSQARRAERLVLALDRLLSPTRFPDKSARAQPVLQRLFADVESLPDFNPSRFAADLKEFEARLAGLPGK